MHSVNSATKYSQIIKWFITLQREFNVCFTTCNQSYTYYCSRIAIELS